jgi:deoxyadenosine/deoxycytidine kinase
MKETLNSRNDHKELLSNHGFSVTIIGDASSGKTTLLNYLQQSGFSVRPEPDNAMFSLFLKNPEQYAYHNQLYKTTQLMEQELQASESANVTNPRFNESGVIATDIYNRYLRDQNLMTADQFEHLNGVYTNYLDTMPKPDLVVYLYADDAIIRDRALRRDGIVAHDPKLLQPYWDRLLGDLEKRGIPVYKVNTGDHPIEETADMILQKTERLKRASVPTEILPGVQPVR